MFLVSWRTVNDETFTKTDVVRIDYAEVDETECGGSVNDQQVLLWFDDGTGYRFPYSDLATMQVMKWEKGWTEKVNKLKRKGDLTAAAVSERDVRDEQQPDN